MRTQCFEKINFFKLSNTINNFQFYCTIGQRRAICKRVSEAFQLSSVRQSGDKTVKGSLKLNLPTECFHRFISVHPNVRNKVCLQYNFLD